MKKLLSILLVFLSISPLYGMQQSYSLLPLDASSQENASSTMHIVKKTSYEQPSLSHAESEPELAKLREQLKTKEQELTSLSTNHDKKLRRLHRQRREENRSSNTIISFCAMAYYFINQSTQLAGDPRLWEDKGQNWSILPFCNNFFGWIGSDLYMLTQCYSTEENN